MKDEKLYRKFFQALVHSTARKMDLWVIACVPVPVPDSLIQA